jgi:hypothetical protein
VGLAGAEVVKSEADPKSEVGLREFSVNNALCGTSARHVCYGLEPAVTGKVTANPLGAISGPTLRWPMVKAGGVVHTGTVQQSEHGSFEAHACLCSSGF